MFEEFRIIIIRIPNLRKIIFEPRVKSKESSYEKRHGLFLLNGCLMQQIEIPSAKYPVKMSSNSRSMRRVAGEPNLVQSCRRYSVEKYIYENTNLARDVLIQ